MFNGTTVAAPVNSNPSLGIGDYKPTGRSTDWGDWLIIGTGRILSRTTYADLFAALTVVKAGTTTSGSATVNVPDVEGIWPGQFVEGPGIPVAAKVLSVQSVGFTLNVNAGVGAGSGNVRILPHGQGDGSSTFNLPPVAGRTLVAASDGPLNDPQGLPSEVRTPGEGGGETMHLMTAAESGEKGHDHGSTASGGRSASHNHYITSGGNIGSIPGGGTRTASGIAGEYVGVEPQEHVHYTDLPALSGSDATQPHNNMPPYLVTNWAIRWKVSA